MKLRDALGKKALLFSVLCFLFTGISYAADTSVDGWGGWGWNTFTTYVGTLGTQPEQNIRIPVLMGVEVSNLSDTWGDARSSGRTHEGTDIMAARGTPVVSPAKAIVMSTGYGSLGGNYIYTMNAGGDRYYFAHLDSYAEGIVAGKVLEPGDIIGYVGNTGNASGGPTHLHFGIYNQGATNPYPRLTLAFTDTERLASFAKFAEQASNSTEAKTLLSKYASFFKKEQAKGIAVSQKILDQLDQTTLSSVSNSTAISFSRNLTLGSKGEDVRMLQKFLNAHGTLIAASGFGSPGNETAYFGAATKTALALYQKAIGINPSIGYFGPLTRSIVAKESGSLAVH